jgi:DNA repair exonuclease SbcCD ATPase subunit
MKISRIRFKNIGSYGNKIQEIQLSSSGGFYVVLGGNGVGKSTISNVIKFCLYGKVDGKKMGDIPNRINKEAWAEIELEAKGKHVIVERGINPTIFNVRVDGNDYDRAGKSNVQKYLEEEILEIPFYVFSNVISLSINDFKSFLNMSLPDKRAIIDRIFGFSLINQMREMIKEESSSLKLSLNNLDGRISSTKESLDSSLIELEELSNKINSSSKERLKDLKTNLSNFVKLQAIHEVKFAEFIKQEKELVDSKSKVNALIIGGTNNIKNINFKLNLYLNDKCPTCSSDLDNDFHHNLKEGLEEEKIKEDKVIRENNVLLRELENKEKEISKTKTQFIEKGSKIQVSIRLFKEELEKLDNKDQNDQITSLSNINKKLEKQLSEAKKDKIKSEDKITWLKILEEILGERGVKQMAIKTILPSLNGEIFKLLQEMHLEYRVVFDDEFNASLTHLGMDITSSSLSTGEMKKVDFAVLISVIRLMKIRFPGINLLFLDEIFSSVDSDGIYSILKILNHATTDLGLNIFVISHNPLPTEVFDYKIEIEKKNNFSNLIVEKI